MKSKYDVTPNQKMTPPIIPFAPGFDTNLLDCSRTIIDLKMKFSAAALALAFATNAFAQTILDVVVESGDHTTLEAAVSAADPAIAALLSDEASSLTVFAPTDEAFGALPEGTVALLTSTPWQPHLNCVLQGHVYTEGAVDAETVTSIAPTSVPSALAGYSLDLDATDGVTINGVLVETPDISATNGKAVFYIWQIFMSDEPHT